MAQAFRVVGSTGSQAGTVPGTRPGRIVHRCDARSEHVANAVGWKLVVAVCPWLKKWKYMNHFRCSGFHTTQGLEL